MTAALLSRIEQLKPWYHRIDFGEGVVTPAPRDQRIEMNILRRGLKGSLAGKTVLELGANAGGLTMLLAQEAKRVTAIEPVEPFYSQAVLVKERFGLDNVTVVKETAYNVHRLGSFDVVVFNGLIYHLRHPQLMLDVLGHICREQIFVSAQVCDSDDPILRNRRANTRFKREGNSGRELLGWEPSVNALSRMIELAGFKDPRMLSRRTQSQRHEGETGDIIASNDVYFCADAATEPVAVPHLFDGRKGYGF